MIEALFSFVSVLGGYLYTFLSSGLPSERVVSTTNSPKKGSEPIGYVPYKS